MKSADIVSGLKEIFGSDGKWKRLSKKKSPFKSVWRNDVYVREFENKNDGRRVFHFEEVSDTTEVSSATAFYTGGDIIYSYALEPSECIVTFIIEDKEIFDITGKLSQLGHFIDLIMEKDSERYDLIPSERSDGVDTREFSKIKEQLAAHAIDDRLLDAYAIITKSTVDNIKKVNGLIDNPIYYEVINGKIKYFTDSNKTQQVLLPYSFWDLFGIEQVYNSKTSDYDVLPRTLELNDHFIELGDIADITNDDRLKAVINTFGDAAWVAGKKTVSNHRAINGKPIIVVEFTETSSNTKVQVLDDGKYIAAWNGVKFSYALNFYENLILVIDDTVAVNSGNRGKVVSKNLHMFIKHMLDNDIPGVTFDYYEDTDFLVVSNYDAFKDVIKLPVAVESKKLTSIFSKEIFGSDRDDIIDDWNDFFFAEKWYFDIDGNDGEPYIMFHHSSKNKDGLMDQHVSDVFKLRGKPLPLWLNEVCENSFESDKSKAETITTLESLGFVYSKDLLH